MAAARRSISVLNSPNCLRVSASIMAGPLPGGLGVTSGWNALAFAAAHGVLDAFELEGLIALAEEIVNQLGAGLERLAAAYPAIGTVRGVGFMRAIEFVTDQASKTPDADTAQKVIDEAREGGLLVIKCGVHRNIVRFLAPLVLSDADLASALDTLAVALKKVC